MVSENPQQDQETAISAAVEMLQARLSERPAAGIILGSGLGGVVEAIRFPTTIPYRDVPGFAISTAHGHPGQLIAGRLDGQPVIAMAGRFHRYEGYTPDAVRFPVRVLAALGVDRLVVTNAAGGLNRNFTVGDLVIIRDHLNWMNGVSKPGGDHRHELGGLPRRHGVVYDPVMTDAVLAASLQHGFPVHEGTYLATLGPTYETRSEYRMMRRVGADLVGMSTVPEVEAAVDSGLRVMALSMVSNVANPDRPEIADHDEVLQAGRTATAKMEVLIRAAIGCR